MFHRAAGQSIRVWQCDVTRFICHRNYDDHLLAIVSVDVTPVSWSRDVLPDVAQHGASAHSIVLIKQLLTINFTFITRKKYLMYIPSQLLWWTSRTLFLARVL
jgi:hypothetical protein